MMRCPGGARSVWLPRPESRRSACRRQIIPHTLRLVSETFEQRSSSMGRWRSTLVLMDAGVPLPAMAASRWASSSKTAYLILFDIQGL